MQCSNGIARKTEKKNIFFFLFPQPIVFLFTACSQNTPVHARTCVCAVCSAEGRDIPLYLSCEASTNLRKANSSLTDKLLLCFAPKPLQAPCRFYSTAATPTWRSYCVPLIVNKSLKPSASIGPSLVLCLIHCRSPTPSAIYFVSQSFDLKNNLEIPQLSTEWPLPIFTVTTPKSVLHMTMDESTRLLNCDCIDNCM